MCLIKYNFICVITREHTNFRPLFLEKIIKFLQHGKLQQAS
jgi:hypothetical protein